MVVALVLAMVPDLDVFNHRRLLEASMGEKETIDFLLVNRIHLGHYAGALIGTVIGAVSIRARSSGSIHPAQKN